MIQAKGKSGPQANNPSQLLPSELIDRCIGSQIWVILKGAPRAQQQECSSPGQQYTVGNNALWLWTPCSSYTLTPEDPVHA